MLLPLLLLMLLFNELNLTGSDTTDIQSCTKSAESEELRNETLGVTDQGRLTEIGVSVVTVSEINWQKQTFKSNVAM